MKFFTDITVENNYLLIKIQDNLKCRDDLDNYKEMY